MAGAIVTFEHTVVPAVWSINVTVPVGTVAPEENVTVAVRFTDTFTVVAPGEVTDTPGAVVFLRTDCDVVPVLDAKFASPVVYTAVMVYVPA